MPDPKDNAKASGDVHPPEAEDLAQGRPRGHPDTEGASGRSGSPEQQDEARPGKGENQAGFLKDKDAPGTGGEPSGA